MTTIHVSTIDQILTATVLPKIACNNQNSIKLHVSFCEAWDGYGKTAIFYTSKNPTVYEKVLSSDNICFIPPEVLTETGHLFIGVKGVNGSSVKMSTILRYKIEVGTPMAVISEPTEDVYNQLLTAYGETNERITATRTELNNAMATANADLSQRITTESARLDNIIAANSPSVATDVISLNAESVSWDRFYITTDGENAKLVIEGLSESQGGLVGSYIAEIPEHLAPAGDIEMPAATEEYTLDYEETPRYIVLVTSAEGCNIDYLEIPYTLATPFEPELPDIRVAYNGEIHASAGGAVRSQIELLADGATRIYSQIPLRKISRSCAPTYTGAYTEFMKKDFTVGNTYLIVAETVQNYVNSIGMINKSNTWEKLNPKTNYGESFIYGTVKPTEDTNSFAVMYNDLAVGEKYKTNVRVYDVTAITETIDDDFIKLLIDGYTVEDINRVVVSQFAPWYGKKALAIGDSLTSEREWQKKLTELLGMEVTTHAYGGMGILQCVKGSNDYDEESGTGSLRPLKIVDVHDKDLIIFYAGYNNRGLADGVAGDCYALDGSGQSTIAGYLQFALNWIFEKLQGGEEDGVYYAPNLTCRVMVITPHCVGKYSYIDADGYEEYPTGSNQSLQTLAQTMEDVANYNNIPCYNAWKNSGINRHTWCVYASSASAESDKTEQGSGGQYYWNADQVHLNKDVGYPHLGTCIAKFINTI